MCLTLLFLCVYNQENVYRVIFMKKVIVLFCICAILLSFFGCSFFENGQGGNTFEPVLTARPTDGTVKETMNPEDIMSELFPDGIARVFRDAYGEAESDETYGSVWSIYYAGMTPHQYWKYISSLVFDSSYHFDIVNSDRAAADMLLANQAGSVTTGGVIKTCIDDPDYAYVAAYLFESGSVNTNGFEYTVRLDITLYDVEADSDKLPDNSAKYGSVIGMDKEKADKAFFPYDSDEYIVTETAQSEYGGYDCIEKYSFGGDAGHMISKRLRLTFDDELNMLMWCYDNMAYEKEPLYLSIRVVQNTVYAVENIETFEYASQSMEEFAEMLDKSGVKFYES